MHLFSVVHLLQNRLQYVTRLPAWRLSAVYLSHPHGLSHLCSKGPAVGRYRYHCPDAPLPLCLCHQETIFCRFSISPVPGGWAHCGPVSKDSSGSLPPQTWWMQAILSAKQLVGWKDKTQRERGASLLLPRSHGVHEAHLLWTTQITHHRTIPTRWIHN